MLLLKHKEKSYLMAIQTTKFIGYDSNHCLGHDIHFWFSNKLFHTLAHRGPPNLSFYYVCCYPPLWLTQTLF